MKVIYDLFDVLVPLVAPVDKKKKMEKDFFRDCGDKPEKKKIQHLEEVVNSKNGYVV